MRTYNIKVKQTFEGIIKVNADSKFEAKFIVNSCFAMPVLNVSDHHTGISNSADEKGIVSWDFDIHSKQNKL